MMRYRGSPTVWPGDLSVKKRVDTHPRPHILSTSRAPESKQWVEDRKGRGEPPRPFFHSGVFRKLLLGAQGRGSVVI